MERFLELKQTYKQILLLKEFHAELVKVCEELDALQDSIGDLCKKQSQRL